MDDRKQAVIFGCGFVGLELARTLVSQGWAVAGTGRSGESLSAITASGATAMQLDDPQLGASLGHARVVLGSIPPGDAGDPALARWKPQLATAPRACAIYLSTTGVYGDRGGRWVFEEEVPTPLSPEACRRVVAERQWLELDPAGVVLRLPGIYGPGRSAIEQVRAGTARAIVRPGQVFSRIHRDDIVSAILAAMVRSRPGRIYNLCDDAPAPSHQVNQEAARLLGQEPLPELPFEAAGLSPMAQRFWAECKRVSNSRAKAELGWQPRYRDYRTGLQDCLARTNAPA